MNDHEKLLWIDGCPAGSGKEDFPREALAQGLEADAGARDLFERVRECDASVRQALDDVPLPEGFSSRILERLKGAREEAARLAAPVPAAPAAAPAPAERTTSPAVLPLSDRPRTSRRRWLAAAAVLVSGLGLATYSYLYPKARELTNEDLWEEFLGRFAEQHSQAPRSQPLTSAPRKAFPVCDLNAGVAVRGWHPIYVDVLERDGVCYYLRTADGRTAVLWVLPLEGNPPVAPHLATAALQASRNTAGLAVTAWKSREVIYVLVAQGDTLTPFVGASGLT